MSPIIYLLGTVLFLLPVILGAITTLIQNWPSLRNGLSTFFNSMVDAFKNLFASIVNSLKNLFSNNHAPENSSPSEVPVLKKQVNNLLRRLEQLREHKDAQIEDHIRLNVEANRIHEENTSRIQALELELKKFSDYRRHEREREQESFTTEKNRLKEENENLKTQINILNVQIQSQDSNARLNQQNQTQENQIKDLSKKLEDTKKQLETLSLSQATYINNLSRNSNNIIAELNLQLKNASDELLARNQIIEQSNKKVTEQQATIAQLQNNNAAGQAIQSENAQLNSQITSLKNENSQLVQEIQVQSTTLKQQETTIVDQSKQNQSHQVEIQRLGDKVNQTEQRVVDLNQFKIASNEEILTLNTLNQEQQKTINEQAEKIKYLEQLIQTLPKVEEIDVLNNKMNELNNQYSVKEDSFKNQINELSNETTAQKIKIENLSLELAQQTIKNNEFNELTNQHEKLKKEHEVILGEKSFLATTLSQLVVINDNDKKSRDNVNNELIEQKTQNQGLLEKISHQDKAFNDLNIKLANQSRTLTDLTSRFSTHKNVLQVNMTRLKDNNITLESEKNNLIAEKEILNRKFNELEELYAKLLDKSKSLPAQTVETAPKQVDNPLPIALLPNGPILKSDIKFTNKADFFQCLVEKGDFGGIFQQIDQFSKNSDSDKVPYPAVTSIAIQGGGAKGAVYPCSLKALNELGEFNSIKTAAGASAGAITAFMIGIGLQPDQIELLSNMLNFQDFLDYAETCLGKNAPGGVAKLMNLATIGAAHTGQNFYDLIGGILQIATGNPDITFEEFAEFVKDNPALKNMIFKAFNIHNITGVTFSAKDSPKVIIRDALRASMSFPGVFAPWLVHEKINGKRNPIGFFADGGLACNYPREVLDDNVYVNPYYDKVNSVNPSAIGFSISSSENRNPEITPFTPTEIRLKLDKLAPTLSSNTHKKPNVRNKNLKANVNSPSLDKVVNDYYHENKQPPVWRFKDIPRSLYGHFLGTTQVIPAEDMQFKKKLYANVTVEMSRLDKINTLSFEATKFEIQELGQNGYESVMEWYKKYRSGVYPHATNFKKMPNDFLECMNAIKDTYSVILSELDKSNPDSNPRLSFYSHYLKTLIQKYSELNDSQEHSLHSLEKLFSDLKIKHENNKSLIKTHTEKLNEILDPNKVLARFIRLVNEKDFDVAVSLFKQQLSLGFHLLTLNQGALITACVKSGNRKLLKTIFDIVKSNHNMLFQQNRHKKLPHTVKEFFQYAHQQHSIYKSAMGLNNSPEILLDLSNEYNLLELDSQGKNAIHYAIDSNDSKALETLINHCEDNHKNFREMRFGELGNTYGHYLIHHLKNHPSLSAEKKDILLRLFSHKATNYAGFTQSELMSATLTKEQINQYNLQNYFYVTEDSLKDYKQNFKDKQNAKNDFNDDIFDKREVIEKSILSNSSIQIDISKLTELQCLALLRSMNDKDENLIIEAAVSNNNFLSTFVHDICNKIRASKNQDYINTLDLMLETRHQRKQCIYHAAENNNSHFIHLFRESSNLSVDDAGPVENRSALLAAAKNGQVEAALAIINSKPSYARYNKKPVTRCIKDIAGKTALHWIAERADVEGFMKAFAVLFPLMGNMLDNEGNSVFFYLLKNPHFREILQKMMDDKLCISYHFDLETRRQNGFSDLAWMRKMPHDACDLIVGYLERTQQLDILEAAQLNLLQASPGLLNIPELKDSRDLQLPYIAPKFTRVAPINIVDSYKPNDLIDALALDNDTRLTNSANLHFSFKSKDLSKSLDLQTPSENLEQSVKPRIRSRSFS